MWLDLAVAAALVLLTATGVALGLYSSARYTPLAPDDYRPEDTPPVPDDPALAPWRRHDS